MELQSFNPWWKAGKVSTEFTGRKRKIFGEIVKYIDKRQIVRGPMGSGLVSCIPFFSVTINPLSL